MKDVSVLEVTKQAVLAKIEDEIDLKIAEKAYEEYLANPVTYSLEEVKQELGFLI